RLLLLFPKPAAKMAALQNDLVYAIARLRAPSGSTAGSLLCHLSSCRLASQRPRTPAPQTARSAEEGKRSWHREPWRSCSSSRTALCCEKPNDVSTAG